MSVGVFGVPASDLVDQIVSLQELWAADGIERLLTSLSRLVGDLQPASRHDDRNGYCQSWQYRTSARGMASRSASVQTGMMGEILLRQPNADT